MNARSKSSHLKDRVTPVCGARLAVEGPFEPDEPCGIVPLEELGLLHTVATLFRKTTEAVPGLISLGCWDYNCFTLPLQTLLKKRLRERVEKRRYALVDAFRRVRSVVGTSGRHFKERVTEGSPDYRQQIRQRLTAVAESLFAASEIAPRRAILRRRLQSAALSEVLPDADPGE